MNEILCFGDSNTWGFDPLTGGRYPADVRWTGRLQAALPGFRILEEGMNGRMTVFGDPLRPYRCGLDALPIALKTHDPLDLVVIMLGTNDCKRRLALTAGEVTQGMQLLVEQVLYNGSLHLRKQPAVLVVAPAPMERERLACGGMRDSFDAGSVTVSEGLADHYEAMAQALGVHYLNAGVLPLTDGVHLSPEGHARLAERMAAKLTELF